MPIIPTGDVEILIAKSTLHSLAEGMAELATKASRIAFSCWHGISEVIGEDVP
jgi:hypothetical protein